jgi:hypothetical protein
VDDTPIPTRPPSPQDTLLREKLVEDIASQSARMDELARQLITLELAVPGIYATALKLVAGDDATVTADVWLVLAFVAWALALTSDLLSLIPRKWAVDTSRLFGERGEGRSAAAEPLSIEGYFRRSALYKRMLLIPSCGLFFIGIGCAVATAL